MEPAAASKDFNEIEHNGHQLDSKQKPVADGSRLQTLSHQDYTIGWICALSIEQTAATAMLDEVHSELPKPPYDENTYTLGRIKKHNIVIACLPKGQYGTIPAAKVATWMIGTFASVRVGVMVGIGGGIPPKVQLGDIVVSTPIAGLPGVIQWDMGKAENSGKFTRTGSLNNPPTVLLTAVTKLETNHTLYGLNIAACLDSVRKQYPRLQSRYVRPVDVSRSAVKGPSQSQWYNLLSQIWTQIVLLALHALGYFHLVSSKVNADIATSVSMEYEDKASETRSGDITIHYGLIASGNQVIKSAAFRDRLVETLGGHVLCVEMEAAGLMNNFPCIVVRGICDFADSHKTKDWQEYAAAIAAAYAKELLEVTDPVNIEHLPEARLIMDALQGIALDTRMIAQRQELEAEEQEKLRREQRQTKIYKWLSPINTYARHSDNRKLRVNNTGTWLLEDPVFIDWRSDSSRCPVLFCHGSPGSGKTILSSLVIDTLQDNDGQPSSIAIGYLYCDYRDQTLQTLVNICGAIIRQFLNQIPDIPSKVWELYCARSEKDLAFTFTDAQELLQLVTVDFSQVYICIDALDEVYDREGLLGFFRNMPPNARLFLTGRPHVKDTVEESFQFMQSLLIEAKDTDIRRFVEHEIGGLNDAEPDAMDPDLKDKIMTSVAESAGGIFLLPVLQIRAVLQNLTIRDREKALETLPSNLGEAFTSSFTRIEQQSEARFERAARIIVWIHLAKEQLTINQLLCALAIKAGDEDFNSKGIPIRRSLLTCCHGLVTLESDSSILRLVHYSLQEYLQQQSHFFYRSREEWHGYIATTSLTFLRFLHPVVDEQAETNDIRNALMQYAATQWGHHLRYSNNLDASSVQLAKDFLDKQWQSNPESLLLLFRAIGHRNRCATIVDIASANISPVHVAAYYGIPEILSYLSSKGLDSDSSDYQGRTPLSYASEHGFELVTRQLLEHGAKVDSMDVNGSAPLIYASVKGHEAIVRLLLDHGATVNLLDRVGWTALLYASSRGVGSVARRLLLHRSTANPFGALRRASQNGYETVVGLLIQSGAAVNIRDSNGLTPLACAAKNGYTAVARLLLEHGAAVDTMGTAGFTPLIHASRNGYIPLAQLLLEYGAKVDWRNNGGWTALLYASRRGYDTLVKMLHDYHATVDLASDKGLTPLMAACEEGHIAVVERLLEYGAAVNSMRSDGWTPLMLASFSGHEAIARRLIETGAVVNAQAHSGFTSLIHASKSGNIALLDLLLGYNATVDLVTRTGRTPLSFASESGHEVIAQHLLEKGAKVDLPDEESRTPLSYAAEKGHQGLVQLLVEHNAIVDSTDREILTPLMYASWNGHETVVKLLLEKGAASDFLSKSGATALIFASTYGHHTAAQLLVEYGASVDLPDSDGWTPLLYASEHGHEGVAQLLLDHAAKANLPNKSGQTPFSCASKRGYKTVVQLLVNHGAEISLDTSVESPTDTGAETLLLSPYEANVKMVGEPLSSDELDMAW